MGKVAPDQMTWDLQIEVHRGAPCSLTEQVRTTIKQAISKGVLRPGVRLPSSRQLAADLKVARSVVVEVYQQLTAEGYLATADRSGTRVSELATPRHASVLLDEDRGPAVRWDLRAGVADVTGFPRQDWLACLQQVLKTATRTDIDYPPLDGTPALREGLAAYLGRVRAVQSAPEDIMVTSGFAQGLALLCQMLRQLGHDALGVEDPGHPGQRAFIENIGLRAVPIHVDEEGLDVDGLAASGVRAVLITPAHQFPTGVVQTPRRRAALMQWAARVDGTVIEDDYDGEFWFESAERPPSLQGSSPDRVIYGGSASKTLAPGLRLGWLVAPPALIGELRRARERQDLGSPTIEQLAYAEFIQTGRLGRHLRRMRSRYRERREILLHLLAQHLRGTHVTGSAAGLHAFVALHPGIDEHALVQAALRRLVLVRGASHYSFHSSKPRPGLVIGYATQTRTCLTQGVTALGAAARDLQRQN
jgi:GntR family transcriptional regulator / MocR family aminotransferase